MQDKILQLKRAISDFQEVDLGYPKGVNELISLSAEELSIEVELPAPSEILDFYQQGGYLQLLDVHNGYFIFSPSKIKSTSLPRYIRSKERPIFIFGSDGGGGFFAFEILTTQGNIIYVPSGRVEETILHPAEPERIVARNVESFIERLTDDVLAFIEEREGWTYMN